MICVCMGFRKRRVGGVDRERDITVFYVYVHLGGVGWWCLPIKCVILLNLVFSL